MKVAKIPQPWASLVMTEAIEYILPFGETVEPNDIILVYAVDEDKRYDEEFKRNSVYDLCYNEMTLGNIEALETGCFLGYFKPLKAFTRRKERIYVSDVHCFEVPEFSSSARYSANILSKACKKANYKTISFSSGKQPCKVEVDGKIQEYYHSYNRITIPLGDGAWEELITNESNVYFYWTDEFSKLIDWIQSFKDKIGCFEDEFEVYFTHGQSKVFWTMLNEDIVKSFIPVYEPDKKTGGKHIIGTRDVLAIYVEQMECYYPDRDAIDKERARLAENKKSEEKKEKRREWVNIIYTPMGNKR